MTPKSELEQHSLNDLLEIQREMRADIKRLEESVRVLAQERLKPASALDQLTTRTLQIQLSSMKASNYDLLEQNRLLEDKLRDRSMDVDRLVKENVALKIKLEEINGR